MAEERTITTVFKADISNFSASTQQLNRYVAQVNSEFKNATASMGRWNDNADGLRAKLEQLNKVHDAESRKLKELEAQYAEAVTKYGENSKQAQKLATAINNQSAVVKETKKNIDFYSDSLKELEDAGVNTKAELDALNKEIAEQEKAAQEAADALQNQKDEAKELGGNVAKSAAAGIVGIGAACAGALAGLNSLVEETKELRTQMGMLETTFTQQGHSVGAAEKTYNDLYAVLGDSGQATEAAQHLAQVAKSEEELEQMTNTLTGVYAAFGSSLPVESLAEAISVSSTLGEVNGALADALEFSGHNVDDFNAQLATLNTEEERAALINETLNGIYGETATKYKEVNKDVLAANEAQNQYNQATAELAEKAQPAITSFKTAMVGVLQTVMDKFSEVDIQGLIGKISGAITYLVTTALPPLITALTWVLNNANWLVPVLGSIVGIIGAISAGIKIYNGVMAIAKTVQLAWNLALSANPIGLVVIAIAGLVTAFVVLWNKCEGFRNFFINMWEGIKKVFSGIGEFVSNVFSGVGGIIKGYINGYIKLINGVIKTVNKIKIPDWEIFGALAGKGLNLKTIPLLARGGIVDKPTLAMVGEAGKEVVMPLENNTQWIDKLAEKLNANGGASNKTYNITNKFERMETSRHALHKANLETKRILREV